MKPAALLLLLLGVLPVQAQDADATDALPPNTHTIAFGYHIGSMPEPVHVPALARAGITLVISLEPPSLATRTALSQAGIERRSLYLGDLHISPEVAARIPALLLHHDPHTTFIHCSLGSDRSLAIAALILVLRHDVSPSRALLSVVHRTQRDIDAALSLLHDAGLVPSDSERLDAGSNAGTRGWGLRNDIDRAFFRSTLETLTATAQEE